MLPHPPKNRKSKDSTHLRGVKFPGRGLPLKSTNEKKSNSKTVAFKEWREPKMNNDKKNTNLRQGLGSREGSFGHYTPLPSIGNQEEKMAQSHYNGKRSLPKSAEKQNPGNQNEDVLLSTIKRMRLGMDKMLSTNSSSSSSSSAGPLQPANQHYKIELLIRLPKGSRLQHTFSSSDTLEKVMRFLSKHMGMPLPLSKFVIYSNEVPKKELNELKKQLYMLDIQDRSVLTLDTRE